MRTAAVVLAGGASRRFGRDKLAAAVSGRPNRDAPTLLAAAVSALPDTVDLVVVGPARPLPRPARFVREDPPGGGPAAGLVTGLTAALQAGAERVVVLPADAPHAGWAAQHLVAALDAAPGTAAVVGVDDAGQEQPLQLALRRAAAEQLVAAAPDGGHGGSARALVRALVPPAQPVPLPPAEVFDIDTPDQLAAWQAQRTAAADAVVALTARLRDRTPADRPVLVALDGASGTGKSTLAAAVRLRTGATVVPGDDFSAPAFAALDPHIRDALGGAEVAATAFDWRRLRREALEPLRRGEPARYRPYAWAARTPGLADHEVVRPPADLVVVEGVYTARPELADVLDGTALVTADEDERRTRLARRDDPPLLAAAWERGERTYLSTVRPPASFDLVVRSG